MDAGRQNFTEIPYTNSTLSFLFLIAYGEIKEAIQGVRSAKVLL